MQVYSFSEITALVNGVEISDWAEAEDVILAERLNDAVTHVVGAGGEMAINVSPDQSGSVTLKLKQTSPANSLLYSLSQAAQNGAFVPINFYMKDNARQDVIQGTVGYIQNPASMTRGNGVNESEWVLVFEKLYLKDGAVSVSGIGSVIGAVAGGIIAGNL